jgi:ribosomal protein S18 acetylase RimI-like enzyme
MRDQPARAGTAAGTTPPAAAIRIRPATAADAEACGNIMHAAFEGIAAAHGFPPDFPSPSDATGLAAAFVADPAIHGVVAEAGGRVLGSNFLSEGDPVRAVGPITVDPAWQGAGVGRRLMETVIDRAGTGARVRLVQDAFNTRSVALYAALGFEVKEPLLLVRGSPHGLPEAGVEVRPLSAEDLPACAALCEMVHGTTRTHELGAALARFAPMAVERGGRLTGYLSAPGLWLVNHGIAETEADMAALLAGAAAAAAAPVSLLLPTRQAGLFRWCLGAGMRVVKPMTLMARGDYQEPRGSWFPSVLY